MNNLKENLKKAEELYENDSLRLPSDPIPERVRELERHFQNLGVMGENGDWLETEDEEWEKEREKLDRKWGL